MQQQPRTTRFFTLPIAIVWGVLIIAAFSVVDRPLIAQEAGTTRLSDRTQIGFVSVDQGKELIGRVDDYVSRTAELERQMRLQTNEPVSIKRFVQAMQKSVKEWTPSEIESVSNIIGELKTDLKAYDLPLPEHIHLIRIGSFAGTNNLPHCRAASIVLPDGFFSRPSRQKTILAHELFHVLSSHNPELRDELYAIIGFKPCNEIALPESLEAKRLTNPDAPTNKHKIELQSTEGESYWAVPILTLNADQYTGGVFMQHMKSSLMTVEKNPQGQWVAKLTAGQPQLREPRGVPDFMKQIGRNTRYIIHPEETLADNFSMLVVGKQDSPDPWVIDQMREVLIGK